MLDTILWWTGAAAWIAFGAIGILWSLDQSIEWIVDGLKMKHEFLEWVWERMKAKRRSSAAE